MTNFPLIHLRPAFTFTCPVCLIDTEDTSCPSCARPLRATDLSKQNNAPDAHLAASTSGASTEGE